ncbi:MAG: sigma 54-interacting transcriptional regulator [Chitinophagaceae bacterium]|nr:sigma 54-interacting transcriptional regulator [Oligoflexus sp.]
MGRIDFLEGALDVGREIKAPGSERFQDPLVDEAVQVSIQEVLRTWKAKMLPVPSFDGTRFHSTFQLDRQLQLYTLTQPIKFGERKMGTLTAVKVCHGSFDPKSEQSFLGILCAMIAQSAMINRFYPDHEMTVVPIPVVSGKPPFDRSHIIGNSKAMETLFELLHQVADADTTVLILGESGVGKELIAEALHKNSSRRAKPFIKVNCAALPETLLESELFGHEKGAFAGAHAQKKGRFELAQGGTLFLDEIGDLTAGTQIKLLRALQQREFERLGGFSTIKTDVRVIAATNHDLETLVETNQFRQDLYYRLNVFPLHILPLSERKTDIMPITDFFIEKYRKIHNKNIRRISTPAIDMLTSYHWPGNVRELENCVERAVLLTNEGVIRGHHLPPSLQIAESTGVEAGSNLKTMLESMERELILDALKSSKGNMAKAARELGLTERVMGLRARKYHLDSRNFRKPGLHA